MQLFEAKIDNNKPREFAGVFDDNYIDCKIESTEGLSTEQYQAWDPYLHNVTNNFKKSGERKNPSYFETFIHVINR